MALSEDIVQDVFLRIWNKNEQERPLPYLMKSAKNRMLEFLRKKNSDKLREIEFSESMNESEQEMIKYEKIDKLNSLVRQLPPKTQEIFKLNKYKGITYAQIAESHNISVKTVENQMARAFKFIRNNW